ncbi:MAG: polymerase, sigma-24 subunit, subfamily [Deltaproteobacteria bacterium]|nr:polymerase, sigma-24 subunit, subfamily [Deltaproteobacteria bacterium]
MIAAFTLLAGVFAESIHARPERDSDESRVARHRAGDPDAFGEIYGAHASAVYRRLSRILGPIAEREDLTQDVFLAVHKALPRFRGDAALATLIQRIAINVAYDHLRRRTRRPTALVENWFFDDLAAPGASPEDQASTRQDLARVFACLARIKPKKRIALLLRVVDGLSFQEIATLVDASVETAAKRVQHGQRELDALLVRAARHEGRRT